MSNRLFGFQMQTLWFCHHTVTCTGMIRTFHRGTHSISERQKVIGRVSQNSSQHWYSFYCWEDRLQSKIQCITDWGKQLNCTDGLNSYLLGHGKSRISSTLYYEVIKSKACSQMQLWEPWDIFLYMPHHFTGDNALPIWTKQLQHSFLYRNFTPRLV